MATTLNLKSINGEVIKIKVKQDPASIITGSTAVTNASNLGGVGLFAQKNGSVLEFKGLVAGSNITLTPSATGVTINSTGGSSSGSTPLTLFNSYTGATEIRLDGIEAVAVTGGTSLGGESIVDGVTNNKINFKGLVAGAGITLTPSITGVTITNSLDAPADTVSNWTTSWFTGVPSTGATGFYFILTNNQGSVAEYTQSISVDDNQKLPLGFDFISQPFPISRFVYSGVFEAILAVEVNSTSAMNKYYIEAYYTNPSGTPIDSGVSGVTVGSLGVRPIALLESSILDLPSSTISNVSLIAILNENFALAAGNRIRFRILAEKVGTTGGAVNNTFYFGYDHDSILRTPFIPALNDVANVVVDTAVNGQVLMYSNGIWLNNNVDYTGVTGLQGQLDSKLNVTLFNSYTGSTATELDLTITGGTSLGTGNAVFAQKTGRNLEFKSLVAGSNITITPSSTGMTISSTGGGAFLPISGGTVTGNTNFSAGANIYGDILSLSTTTTLDSSHAGKTIEANGTFTITLPNSMVTGMKVTIVNVGTGVITIAASGTYKSLDNRNKLRFQYAGASAYHRGSNDWMIIGNLQE